ncbi:cysteine hydrolase family protein [Derxia gummosa]|uniref:Cysteine hydrolase family protein n=1 Tax=Derxia gummosa DSM 723 TaxID=1121388 RepID=A0A8B6X3V2_9BURK|nr:cysteine hydrolase family protein [Derxia gummosa]
MTATALIVIDVQNEYFTGGLPIAFPDREQSVARIASAMDAARAHDLPVVVVRHRTPPGAPIFADGSAGHALHPAVAARPADLVFDKAQASCFADTELADWLAARAIPRVTLVGYMTQNCVDATARHATQLGLAVEILADACGAPDYANEAGRASGEELHRATLVALHAGFGAVGSTEAWIASLDGGPALAEGSIPASVAAAR